MKITGLTVHVLEPRPNARHDKPDRLEASTFSNAIGIIHTDEGVEGVIAAKSTILEQLAEYWKESRSFIEGQDPLDRGQIDRMLATRYRWPIRARGALDHGLWDIAGKLFNRPVYKLLGQTRTRVLAYGSTIHHDDDEKYIEASIACKEHGFKAIKLHPHGIAELDIPLVYKIRKAVGDEMVLLMDSMSYYPKPYTRKEAMAVGRALDDCGFWWYEDPLNKRDVEGLAWLTRELKVNLRAHDQVEDIRDYDVLIANRAMDIMAGPYGFGISELMKLAAVAETHHLGFEPHDYSGGNASLHVLLATHVGTYYEKAVPLGRWYETSYPGVYLDLPQVDREGYVHAPTKPGLGFEIDFNEAKKVTAATIEV